MSEKLTKRITSYAETCGLKSTEVVSLKLRPVQDGAQYADPFGRQDANAYLYASEYSAGKTVADLDSAGDFTNANQFGESVLQFRDSEPAVLWIQHETGLEILGGVAAVVGIVAGLIKIYETIFDKIEQNKKAEGSDRYHKAVREIRVEARKFDTDGNLTQELVYTWKTEIEFDHNELKQKLESELKC